MPRFTILLGRDVYLDAYFPPTKESISIGRHGDADISIDDAMISRRHAVIQQLGDSWMIIDVESQNGIRVGGQRVHEHRLTEGDEVDLGKYTLAFRGEVPIDTADFSRRSQVVRPKKTNVDPLGAVAPEMSTRFVSEEQQQVLQKYLKEKRQAYIEELVEKGQPKKVVLKKNRYVFGRLKDADIRVGGWFSPRVSAQLEHKNNEFQLFSPDGKKRIMVNGEMTALHVLKEGDRFEIRGLRFVFHDKVG
ncbi:MAG: hypothetical protein GMKNLPBB_01457 [Myxococcota bacterium]|nr:hypothetical protein [Myxococcota bacterium]